MRIAVKQNHRFPLPQSLHVTATGTFRAPQFYRKPSITHLTQERALLQGSIVTTPAPLAWRATGQLNRNDTVAFVFPVSADGRRLAATGVGLVSQAAQPAREGKHLQKIQGRGQGISQLAKQWQ